MSRRNSERIPLQVCFCDVGRLKIHSSSVKQQTDHDLSIFFCFLLCLVLRNRMSRHYGQTNDSVSSSILRQMVLMTGCATLGACLAMITMRTIHRNEKAKKSFDNNVSEKKSSLEDELDARWKKLPKRIILLRHGQSEGNVNENVYSVKSDSQLELTDKGIEQALRAGERIQKIVGREPVVTFVSPFERAQETLLCVQRMLDVSQTVEVHVDPRIREAERSNLQVKETEKDRETFEQELKIYYKKKEEWERKTKENPPADLRAYAVSTHPRYPSPKENTIEYHNTMAARLGRFFYRRPNGESNADVYDRVGDFWNALLDEGDYSLCHKFSRIRCEKQAWRNSGDYNVLVVTHGLTVSFRFVNHSSLSLSRTRVGRSLAHLNRPHVFMRNPDEAHDHAVL